MATPYKASDAATPEETMTALGKHFELDSRITEHLVKKLGVKTLQEFRFLAVDDGQVDTVIFRGVPDLAEDTKILMLSRLRRARNAVRMNIEDISRVRIRGDDAEDEVSSIILDELKTNLWTRHKMTWRPDILPADSLGKLHRQFDKRTLTVISLGTVKSLAHQVANPSKRCRVGDVFIIDLGQEETHELCNSISDYLDKLFTLCLAYASAGSRATEKAKTLPKENQDSDTTEYIVAPLDTMLEYHSRAVALSREVPIRDRHEFIRKLDESERSAWVADFRHSSLDFGKVVKKVFLRRDAHWTYHASTPPASERMTQNASPRTPDHPQAPVQAPSRTPPGKGAGKGKADDQDVVVTPGMSALALKNGEKLCQAFNSRASCPHGRDCTQGSHRCSMTTKNKRACGGSSHNFYECRSAP